MKLKTYIAILALSVLVSTSCNNTLKVLAPYKNITVVYGLIDQNDAIHYFRINKAFEGNGNAYTMAQQYDSIYYPVATITAYLQDSNTTTNTIVNTYKLDTTTTVPLGAGTFSYPKQLLYYTNATLNPNDYYNLIIINNKTGQKISGSTALLPDINFSDGFTSGGFLSLSFNTTSPSSITWNTAPNARIYQMTICFYYHQTYQGVTSPELSLNWTFAPTISSTLSGGIGLSYKYTAQDFYGMIAGYLTPVLGLNRYEDSLSVIFTTGSDDLNTYVQLSQPPTGINQDIPFFTNLKNGVGLYTARHIQRIRKQLNAVALDTLRSGSQTGNLGFQ